MCQTTNQMLWFIQHSHWNIAMCGTAFSNPEFHIGFELWRWLCKKLVTIRSPEKTGAKIHGESFALTIRQFFRNAKINQLQVALRIQHHLGAQNPKLWKFGASNGKKRAQLQPRHVFRLQISVPWVLLLHQLLADFGA